jgi:hypothetical protein
MGCVGSDKGPETNHDRDELRWRLRSFPVSEALFIRSSRVLSQFHSWCPTKPNFFAISSLSSAHGASINIHDIDELHAPLTIPVRPSPHVISDFDWVGQSNDEYPRIAAACGHAVYIGQIAHVRS